MKKFFIKDDDGKKYEVEEVEETVKDEDIETEKVKEINEVKDEEGLTAEEIQALKELAKISPKLIAMCSTTDEETEKTEEIEEMIGDEEEIDDEDETEKVLKTDSIKSSSVSLEKPKKVIDSIEEDSVANAWAKRYETYGR